MNSLNTLSQNTTDSRLRKNVLSLAFLTVLCALALMNAGRVRADGLQDFTLHNQTGLDIVSVYVSPHDEDSWNNDVLGDSVLDDGDSVHISFSPYADTAYWDLKVVDSEGTSHIWYNLDLLRISSITIHLDDGVATADTE